MPVPVPSQSESAYLAYAMVNALLDFLVTKSVITTEARLSVYRSARQLLLDSGGELQKRAAQFIADQILPKN